MIKRFIPASVPASVVAVASVAALSFGAAGCTRSEQDKAEDQARVVGDHVQSATQQAGEVIESGAMKGAQAVESGAGDVADKLERNQARAAAEGRPGAVDPATDQRVPSSH